MRKELDKYLTEIAHSDPNLYVVVPDLGSFKLFSSQFPERFINVGVAEQNSVGISAGIADEGKRVILNSVAGFTIYRAFEQIKYSIGYWNKSVTIIGTGFGWRYHQIGRGHHAPDDIALMRLIPNMKIYTPVDAKTIAKILQTSLNSPKYIRLGEGINSEKSRVSEFGDIIIVALGEIKKRCIRVANELHDSGYNIGLIGIEEISFDYLKKKLIAVKNITKLIIIEDHVEIGGLGDMIRNLGYTIDAHICLPINTEEITTEDEKLVEYYGFDTQSIKKTILNKIQ